MSQPAFVPLANMTPELDALMPPAGPCLICGGPDKRHRLIDAIRGRHHAGDSVAQLVKEYAYRGGGDFIRAVLALRPVRIQRRRERGWRMPWGTAYVGRPSRWGNPFPIGVFTRPEAVRLYRPWAEVRIHEAWVRGKDWLEPLCNATALACWCPLVDARAQPVPCHADVLIELLRES